MFSMITNIYNKKTKAPTLKEFFTATGKLKRVFFFFFIFSMCAPRVTRHTLIRYSTECTKSYELCRKFQYDDDDDDNNDDDMRPILPPKLLT
jgi:hypothetical protein